MYETPIFPIVLADPPQAPEPEGRLLITLDNGTLLASLPYTQVHLAVGALVLNSSDVSWKAGATDIAGAHRGPTDCVRETCLIST